MEDKDKTAPENKPVKSSRTRGRSPVIGENGLLTEPGDNAKYLTVNLALMKLDAINLRDEAAVSERLQYYFELYAAHDMKPTVAGMALALGMNRRTLWAITHDAPLGGRGNYSTLPAGVTDTIKKAYFILENLWEMYMNSGKINPVSGIFLGKNNFGYQDKSEYVLTPNTSTDDYDVEDIRKRYMLDTPGGGNDDENAEE